MRQAETHTGGAVLPNIWLLGIRPRTLTMAAVPVATGAALAWSEGATADAPTFALTLVCAVLIQIGTNLFNDAGDGARGADGADRIGPLRLTGAGLATAGQGRGAAACFAAALAAGIYLVWVGGTVILLIGIASLVSGYAYSSGPRPLSQGPSSEVWVVAFFGVVAVAGSYYLQALAPPGDECAARTHVAGTDRARRAVLPGGADLTPAAALLADSALDDIASDSAAAPDSFPRCTGLTLLESATSKLRTHRLPLSDDSKCRCRPGDRLGQNDAIGLNAGHESIWMSG